MSLALSAGSTREHRGGAQRDGPFVLEVGSQGAQRDGPFGEHRGGAQRDGPFVLLVINNPAMVFT